MGGSSGSLVKMVWSASSRLSRVVPGQPVPWQSWLKEGITVDPLSVKVVHRQHIAFLSGCVPLAFVLTDLPQESGAICLIAGTAVDG